MPCRVLAKRTLQKIIDGRPYARRRTWCGRRSFLLQRVQKIKDQIIAKRNRNVRRAQSGNAPAYFLNRSLALTSKRVPMGLMDDLQNSGLGSLLGGSSNTPNAAGAANSNPMLVAVLQMLKSHPGGLAALVQGFQSKGLGDVMSSWIGTGQNMPISADQVTHVLGADKVNSMAAQAGVTPAAAGGSLAALLPMLINHLHQTDKCLTRAACSSRA